MQYQTYFVPPSCWQGQKMHCVQSVANTDYPNSLLPPLQTSIHQSLKNPTCQSQPIQYTGKNTRHTGVEARNYYKNNSCSLCAGQYKHTPTCRLPPPCALPHDILLQQSGHKRRKRGERPHDSVTADALLERCGRGCPHQLQLMDGGPQQGRTAALGKQHRSNKAGGQAAPRCCGVGCSQIVRGYLRIQVFKMFRRISKICLVLYSRFLTVSASTETGSQDLWLVQGLSVRGCRAISKHS